MATETITKVNVNGQVYNLGGAGGSDITNITYSELVALKDGGNLVAGSKYRITDYVTSFKDWESGNHQFDIIVTAFSNNSFYEEAKAALHEGDDYFAGSDLDSWKIWYDITNNTDRFAQANTSGKGTILRMVDEFNNDANYDFKNAMFEITSSYHKSVPTTLYFYTFSYFSVSVKQLTQENISDMSIRTDCKVYDNYIELNISSESFIVIGGKNGITATLNPNVFSNKFEKVRSILILSDGFGGTHSLNTIIGKFIINNPVTVRNVESKGSVIFDIKYVSTGILLDTVVIKSCGGYQTIFNFPNIGSSMNLYALNINSYFNHNVKAVFDNAISNWKTALVIINDPTADIHISETSLSNTILSVKNDTYKITDLSV